MKKFVLVFAIMFVILTCASCTPARESKLDSLIKAQEVTFEVEGHEDQLGSYVAKRSNLDQQWVESGSWSSEIELTFDPNKRICAGYLISGTFWAAPDYKWVKTQSEGRDCLMLKRK